MSRRAKLAATVFFFGLLGWLYIHTGRLPGAAQHLEFRLAGAAQAALADTGHDDWARVEMNGRRAVVSGIAPDEDARADVLAAIAAVADGGVSRVDDATDLQMVASPYTFEARLDGERLTLAGYAPDRATREAIAARAALVFAGEVDATGVAVASGAPRGSDWIGAVDFGVSQLARMNQGVLKIVDTAVTIDGDASDPEVAAEVARQIRQAPAPFEGRALFAPPPRPSAPAEADVADAETVSAEEAEGLVPQPPEPPDRTHVQLAQQTCQSQIDTLLEEEAVRFRFDDAEVSPASGSLLSAVANVARQCEDYRLLITGHTDSSGDPAFNVYLSEQRARAVADFLVSQGVDPAGLVAEGRGSSEPIASNDTRAGRAQNRRIEIDVAARREALP